MQMLFADVLKNLELIYLGGIWSIKTWCGDRWSQFDSSQLSYTRNDILHRIFLEQIFVTHVLRKYQITYKRFWKYLDFGIEE